MKGPYMTKIVLNILREKCFQKRKQKPGYKKKTKTKTKTKNYKQAIQCYDCYRNFKELPCNKKKITVLQIKKHNEYNTIPK